MTLLSTQKAYQQHWLLVLLFVFFTSLSTAACNSCGASKSTDSSQLKFEQLVCKYDLKHSDSASNNSLTVIFDIKNSGSKPAEKLQVHYKNVSQAADSQTVLLNNKQEDTIDLPSLKANSSTGEQALAVVFKSAQITTSIEFQFDLISNGQIIHTQNLQFTQFPLNLLPITNTTLIGDKETEFKFKIKKQEHLPIDFIDFKDIKLTIRTYYNKVDVLVNNTPFLDQKISQKSLEGDALQKIADLDQEIILTIKPTNATTKEETIKIWLSYYSKDIGEIEIHWFKDNSQALLQAVNEGDIKLTQKLIRQGAKVDIKDGDGDTLLHLATGYHTTKTYPTKEMVEELCKAGADVNAKGKNDRTPLHGASAFNLDALRLLSANEQVDPNIRDTFGLTPIQTALADYNLHAFKVLLENSKKVDVNVINNKTGHSLIEQTFDIINMQANPYKDTFFQILLADTRINLKTKEGTKLLQAAVRAGDKKVVETLLDKGISIDSQDDTTGDTALHIATFFDKKEIVDLLLQKKANKDAKNKKDKTALHYAAESKNKPLVQTLLDAGANSKITDSQGKTAANLTDDPTIQELFLKK